MTGACLSHFENKHSLKSTLKSAQYNLENTVNMTFTKYDNMCINTTVLFFFQGLNNFLVLL